MEEVSQESNLTPSDARPKFYALSDESLARSLQDEEYTSVGERNRQLRQRMKNQVSLVKEDEELASQLNSLDVSGAKQDLALQEKVATEEQDKELAQLLHRQESVQSKETEDERIAREMQDAEYAAYMQLKEKRKVELRMQKMEQQRQLEAQKTQQLLEGEQRQLQELERQRLEGELKTRRLLEEEKRQLDERERQRQQPQQSQGAPLAKSASAADVPDEELARRMQQAEVLQYRHALQSRAASAAALQQQQPVTPGSATHVALPNPGPPQTAQGGASGHPANVRQQSMPTIPTQHIPAGQETQSLPTTTTGAVQGRMAIRKRAMSDGRSAQTGHQQQQQQQQQSTIQEQQQTQPPLQEAPRTPTTAAAAGTPSPGTVARGLAATQEEDLKLVPKMGKRRVTKKQK
ncbi:putative uncharacterized protein DDB_G0271606 isoform X2 [Sycon ciliatum]|uniref:putative uncharacterized protein DDB_G0271606 isoform X2 n=1 Tax=Sycon ciliatum TaxID=27933 RepID=UPI0031F6F281